MLFQYQMGQPQSPTYFVRGPMMIDSKAEPNLQLPSTTPVTPTTLASSSCTAGPSPSSQGSETSFDCSHCGKSLRSRKNYSKHMFIHSGMRAYLPSYLCLMDLPVSLFHWASKVFTHCMDNCIRCNVTEALNILISQK